jgi:hypothetical protein
MIMRLDGLIAMKPMRKLSELRGILKDVKRPAREIVRELRKEAVKRVNEARGRVKKSYVAHEKVKREFLR